MIDWWRWWWVSIRYWMLLVITVILIILSLPGSFLVWSFSLVRLRTIKVLIVFLMTLMIWMPLLLLIIDLIWMPLLFLIICLIFMMMPLLWGRRRSLFSGWFRCWGYRFIGWWMRPFPSKFCSKINPNQTVKDGVPFFHCFTWIRWIFRSILAKFGNQTLTDIKC